jgi:RHS repeat-associated protein
MRAKFATMVGLSAFVLSGALLSQDIVPAAVNDQNRTGSLPFSGSIQGPVDSIDLSGGGLTINIPILKVKGRGLDYTLVLRYSSLFWAINDSTSGAGYYSAWGTSAGNWLPGHVVGWETNQPYITWLYTKPYCLNGVGGVIYPIGGLPPGNLADTSKVKDSYVLTDENGTKHTLNVNWATGGCFGYTNNGPDDTSSGWWAGPLSASTPRVLTEDGSRYGYGGTAPTPTTTAPGMTFPMAEGMALIEDTNGNTVSLTPGGMDTLGRDLVTVTEGTNQIFYTFHDANGTLQTVTVNLSTVPISTSFATVGVWGFDASEASGSLPVVSSIDLPNAPSGGHSYQFTYESGSYAGITSMTVPSGATINYTWATVSGGEYVTHRYVASRSVTVNSVTSNYAIDITPVGGGSAPSYQTTVTSPDGNQQVYMSTGGHITSAQYYAGTASGPPLKEVDVAYETPSFPEVGSSNGWDTALPTSVTTTMSSSGYSIQNQVQYQYDSFTYPWTTCLGTVCDGTTTFYTTTTYTGSRGNVVKKLEYDWGTPTSTGTSPSPGSLLRETDNTFLYATNSSYLTANIVDRLATQIVYAGTTAVAKTNYSYDGTTPTPISGVPQHSTPATNYRGNLTSVSRWRSTDGSYLTTTYTYDDTGNITAITDPMSHTTTWSYADSWAYPSGNCLPTAASYAYPTTVTDALSHSKNVVYRNCTGQEQSVSDPNDIANARVGTQYTYDLMDRVLSTSYADGGSTANAYTDTVPNLITTTVAVNGTVSKQAILEKDALGRDRKTTLVSDPDGATYTRIAYDAMGRKAQEWNPTRCDPDMVTSCTGETTFGYTTYDYDALSREILLIPPDGNATTDNIQTSYSVSPATLWLGGGVTTTVTDEDGIGRAATSDALGRLVQATEVNSGRVTGYTYDTLGNLTCVEQHGFVSGTGCTSSPSSDATSPWRVRRFTYDSLSELLAAKNPEAGASTATCGGTSNPWSICYTYNNDGILTSKTDARGVTISYSYDALNRVRGKTYSDGEPSVAYFYDGGAAANNGILHRTEMTDASGLTTWVYDSEGRPTSESKTINTYNRTISTQYNLDGSVWKLTYPGSVVIEYTPGGAGRPLAVTDDTHSIQYAKSASYAPQGALQSLILGYTSTFAGITETDQYNTQLQPSLLSAASPSQTVMSLSYNFKLGSYDNGQVYQIVNNKDATRTQTIGYDGASRIASARTPSTWGLTFTIDSWGNLYQTSPISGTAVNPMSLSTTVLGNNQLAAFGYDAAGNLINDGTTSACGGNNYAWNAEEQMSCAEGVTYTYDGDGARVEKSSGTMYWGGEAGDALEESDLSANMLSQYIFFSGKRIARRDVTTGNVYYYFSDHLGSSSVITNATGAIQNESDYYPFGGENPITLNIANHYKFTGKERDTESGLDYFGARYYASSMGRFMSPDWAAKAMPVPYARLGNPQTLNLYTYVQNSPLRYTDADGHVVTLGENADTAKTDLLKNVSDKERGLFTTTTDKKTGVTTLSIDSKAAADFKGDHTKGFTALSGEIASDKTINVNVAATVTINGKTHDISKEFGGGVTFTDAKGVVQAYASPDGNPTALHGLDGKSLVPDPESIIMGHEALGHGPGQMGLDGGDHSQHHAVEVENQLRREQGIPERQPE